MARYENRLSTIKLVYTQMTGFSYEKVDCGCIQSTVCHFP